MTQSAVFSYHESRDIIWESFFGDSPVEILTCNFVAPSDMGSNNQAEQSAHVSGVLTVMTVGM
jgi:hypothetical protein